MPDDLTQQTDPTTGDTVEVPADDFADPDAVEHADQTADPIPGSPS